MNRQNAKVAKEPRAEIEGLTYRVFGAALEAHRILSAGSWSPNMRRLCSTAFGV
jgi:hypothetical protein